MVLHDIKDSMDGHALSLIDVNEEDRKTVLDIFHKKRCEQFYELYKEKLLFLYYVRDAWLRFVVRIDIFINGIVIIKERDNTVESRIDEEYIKEIIGIVYRNSEFLRSKEIVLENNNYYDGQRYDVILCDGSEYYYFGEYNIWAYTKKYPTGCNIRGIVADIINTLKKSGVECDNKYVYDWLDRLRE